MHVALLHNRNRGESPRDTEFDTPITLDALRAALAHGGHRVSLVEGAPPFDAWIGALATLQPDIVFNVAEGYSGSAREAVYPALLDQLGIPYCGPGATELLVCHNKALTKALLAPHVAASPSVLVRAADALDEIVFPPFPLVVKCNAEGSSLGMSARSIVSTHDECCAQVTMLRTAFGGDVLAEGYVPGRDVSTSFIEGLGIFGPVEYTYESGSMYDFTLKSVRNNEVDIRDLPTTDALAEEARAATARIVDALDLHGYARMDFRLTPEGALVFLEVNAQVCFHPDGAFVRAPMATGFSYDDVVLHILQYGATHPRRASTPNVPHSSSMRR